MAGGKAVLLIALRPDLADADLAARLSAAKGKQSLSTFLRKVAHLTPLGIGLLYEAALAEGVALSALPPEKLAALINAVPVQLTGIAPIARAISTAGGIAFDELDERFMIKRLPGVFAAGEMLDWEAPTGGYLLQGAFATGAAAGRGALKWLGR
jgi:predicted flavoprotein YhiN